MRQPEAVNGMMRQYNDLKKTEKMTNNHIHNTKIKTTRETEILVNGLLFTGLSC
jgi:hypothetical protein